MGNENNSGSNGACLLVGAGLATLVAVAHNSAKNDRHVQELVDMYEQGCLDTTVKMTQAQLARDMEIDHLHCQVKRKDAEIDRLNSVVENLAKALKLSQIQNTVPMLSSGNAEN